MVEERVLYYGYGSNMSMERLGCCAPTAIRKCNGKLKDFQLVYSKYSDKWRGCMAQIADKPGAHVWGVVWMITPAEKDNLRQQEAVNKGVFAEHQVDVVTESGETLSCFTVNCVEPPREGGTPSPQYKTIILQGAKTSGLPQDYVDWLEAHPDNGDPFTFDLEGSNFD